MSEYTIKPLSTETWDAFARLCEKHNGMGFGQCWCTWFHPRRKDLGLDADVEAGRPYKEFLVREGRSHAALVFDGDVAIGWCQYGPPAELPSIFHKKEYEAGLESPPTIASPASSWTAITGMKEWPPWRSRGPWT